MKRPPSLEEETVTLLAELELALSQILARYPDNEAARSRLTHLLALTRRVRERLAPQWSYLKEPPAGPAMLARPED